MGRKKACNRKRGKGVLGFKYFCVTYFRALQRQPAKGHSTGGSAGGFFGIVLSFPVRLCQGNRQEPVFRDGHDNEIFLDTLGEAAVRGGWRVHAFCLMGNHYHLLLETAEPNLVTGMQWLQGTYTKRFNVRHKEWGHLF